MPHPPRKIGDPPYLYVGRPPLPESEKVRRRIAKGKTPRLKMGRPATGLWPDVSRKELARQIGMHPVTVRKILLGLHEASQETIRDIAFILKKEPWRVRRALKSIYEARQSEF